MTVTIDDDGPAINSIQNLSVPDVVDTYTADWDFEIGADGFNAVDDAGPDLNSPEGINISLLSVPAVIGSSSTEDIFSGGVYVGELFTAKFVDGTTTFFTLFVKADGTYEFNLVNPQSPSTTTETLNLQGSVGGNSPDLYAEEIADAKGFPDPVTDIKFTASLGYVNDTNLGSSTSVNTNAFGIGAGTGTGGLRVTTGESLTLAFLVGDADTDGATHPTTAQLIDSIKITFDVGTDNTGNDTVEVRFILHLFDSTTEIFNVQVADGDVVNVEDSINGKTFSSVDVVNVDTDGDTFFISGSQTTITTTTTPVDLTLNFQVEVVDGDGDTATSTFSIDIDVDNNIVSPAGSDSLHGETGVSDTFVYGNLAAGGDTINGFSILAPGAGGDVLDFSAVLTDATVLDAFNDGHLLFVNDGGDVAVQIDLDGGGSDAPVTMATLVGVTFTDVNTALGELQDNIVV